MLQIPVGQKRLTNVAIVRLKTHGKRFEIACYKNKVLNWREGVEKDLEEVIQTDTVFTNVARGEYAKEKDLKQAFGTTNLEEICKKILKSGELQVSDKEREVQLDGIFRDVVQMIVERCVHPATGRQHTPLTVENALKTIGFSAQPDMAPKRQALKGIEALCEALPESFARAKMRLRITCTETLLTEIHEQLVGSYEATVEERITEAGNCSLTFLCNPRHYRELDGLATDTYSGKGVSLQIVTSTVVRSAEEPQAADAMARAMALPREPAATTATATAASSTGARVEQSAPPPPDSNSGAANPVAAVAPRSATAAQTADTAAPPKRGMRCSSCNAMFEDAAEYRSHCKGDWHNFNVKRKVKNLPPASEEEFAEISLDAREGFLAMD